MPDGNALINLGELSKPATTLVEKVCNAVGIIYAPTHVKRMALAEAEANKIKAIARIEVSDLERRALDRLLHQETRKQENIEQITAQAANILPETAKVEKLEEDWVAYFFKQCETVSDKEMQSLWARLLSGEASNPGTVSKRTVDFISTVDKKDAALFTAFCQFVWTVGDAIPLIYDHTNEIYTKSGINFDALKHLDSIGLISFESLNGYKLTGFGKRGHAFYYGKQTHIEFAATEKNELPTGQALFTAIGKELISISGSTKNQEFYDYIIKHWTDSGLILSSVINAR